MERETESNKYLKGRRQRKGESDRRLTDGQMLAKVDMRGGKKVESIPSHVCF